MILGVKMWYRAFYRFLCFDIRRNLDLITSIINIIAIIFIPIIAVIVGQWLQSRAEKRKDKMQAFKVLMTSRIYGWWTPEPVNVLNTIDIVFADDKCVRAAWKSLYDTYCWTNLNQQNPDQHNYDQQHAQKITNAQHKLLESMAIALGYKDKITWETIQSPYYPVGLSRQVAAEAQMRESYYNAISNVNAVVEEGMQQSNNTSIFIPGRGNVDSSFLKQ